MSGENSKTASESYRDIGLTGQNAGILGAQFDAMMFNRKQAAFSLAIQLAAGQSASIEHVLNNADRIYHWLAATAA